MDKKKIFEQVIAGLIVLFVGYISGLFAKSFYFVEPFQHWYKVEVPNYRAIYKNWKVTYPNKEFKDETIEVHQIGPKIWGEGFDVTNNEKYEFTGQFTDSNHITFFIKSSNPNSGYNGTGEFQLDLNGRSAQGYVVHLYKNIENLVPTRFKLVAQP